MTDYEKYLKHLKSDYWLSLKAFVIAQRGKRCQRCKCEPESLHMHHLHYETLYKEKPQDVELLCPACHRAEHEIPEPNRIELIDPDQLPINYLDI